MRPIPLKLLSHSATLLQAATDALGHETLTTITTLTHIRVEAMPTQTLTRQDTQAGLSAVLLYDCRNSRPRGVLFTPGQYVLYKATRYRVQAVEELPDSYRAHHVELTLTE